MVPGRPLRHPSGPTVVTSVGLSPWGRDQLAALARRLGCSRGAAIDYLMALHLDVERLPSEVNGSQGDVKEESPALEPVHAVGMPQRSWVWPCMTCGAISLDRGESWR